PKRKIPYRITRRDAAPFAFAGIWQEGVDAPRPRIPAGVRGDFAAGTRSTLQIEPRHVAGIWQVGVKASPPRFAIITRAADAFMQPIHSRMPVILDSKYEKAWISGDGELSNFLRLLE